MIETFRLRKKLRALGYSPEPVQRRQELKEHLPSPFETDGFSQAAAMKAE
jgi:hypothetical protein